MLPSFARPSGLQRGSVAGAARWLLVGGIALAIGCKEAPVPVAPPPAPAAPVVKAPPPPPEPALPALSCPPAESFAAFLDEPPVAAPTTPEGDKGSAPKAKIAAKAKPLPKAKPGTRALRTDCVVFAPGRFWLAAALSYDQGTGKNPRLGLISGTPGSGRPMIFDVVPLPTVPIEKLLQSSAETGVKIRKTREDTSLVRIGVTGGPGGGKPDKREFGLLLQLMAHKPPQMMWVGPGDEVVTESNGCVTEQRVEFELLFRTRLERVLVGKSLPDASGKVLPHCVGGGPSTQETVGYASLALPSGRYFGADPKAPADKPKRLARP